MMHIASVRADTLLSKNGNSGADTLWILLGVTTALFHCHDVISGLW